MLFFAFLGVLFSKKGNNAEAITALKNGEIFAKKAKNKNAIHHIAELLAFINLKNGNYNTALKYAHIALNNSIATNNKSWIVEDLNRISAIFAGQSKADSSDYYMNEALKKTKDLPQKLKVEFYTNASIYYFNTNKLAESKKYALKSLNIQQSERAQTILGAIYYSEGETERALDLLKKSASSNNLEHKAEALSLMSDIKKEQGEYKEAMKLAERSKAAEDSMKARQQTEDMLALQKSIEKEEAVKNAGQWMPAAATAIAALAIIIIAAAVYHRKKMSRARNLMEEDREKIEMYTQQMESMAASGKDREKEIKKLKKKIEDIRKHEAETVSRGKRLHKEIAEGGTTVKWSKDDFEAFIEYFRIEYAEKAREAEGRYGKLTTNSLFALSLITIGFSDKDIQRIMAITPGALRTIKYRLKKQIKIEN